MLYNKCCSQKEENCYRCAKTVAHKWQNIKKKKKTLKNISVLFFIFLNFSKRCFRDFTLAWLVILQLKLNLAKNIFLFHLYCNVLGFVFKWTHTNHLITPRKVAAFKDVGVHSRGRVKIWRSFHSFTLEKIAQM